MTENCTLIEGFECKPCTEPVLCTGCWDESEHNTEADNDIPAGEPVYYRRCSYEYDEWDAYCAKCAQKYNEDWR